MAELTLVEAINDAFHVELGRDESVMVLGETTRPRTLRAPSNASARR